MMNMTKETRKTLVDELYNRCANGEISLEQRECLILKVNSMYMESVMDNNNTPETSEVVIDTVEEPVKESKQISPNEKYTMFKNAVYKKYSTGEITLEAREELLEKARNEFFTISE